MEYLLSLDDPRSRNAHEVGGKAATLATLRSRGFPVPPGAVVTRRLFREAFVATVRGNVPLIEAGETLASSAGPDDPDPVRRLGPVALPKQFTDELREFLAAFGPDRKLAVRSSSPYEDSDVAAFAGQFDTYLDRVGLESIQEAIIGCLLSCWSRRALAYRRFHRIAGGPAMAVVLQEMIACDLAGVAFTVNPVSGSLDEVLVNAYPGAGRAVVDGERGVTHYVVPKSNPSAGVGPEAWRKKLSDVAQLAATLERTFGFPQDVEWGVAGGRLFLLQCRPVTTIPARWTRDASAERFPRPVTPLAWDIVEAGFQRSLAYSLKLLGFPSFRGKWFSVHDHYVYGNASAMEVYRRRLARCLDPLRDGLGGLRQVLHNLGSVHAVVEHWSRNQDAYVATIGRLNARPLPEDAPETAWQLVRTACARAYEYFAPNIATAMCHRALHAALHETLKLLFGKERAEPVLCRLTLGGDTKTDLVNRELRELALQARRQPALEAIVRNPNSGEALTALGQFPAFLERFNVFVEAHFHREIDHFLDPYYPTLGEQPWRVLDDLRLLLDAPAEEDRSARLKDYYAALAEVAGACPASYRADVLELIALTRACMALDDAEHYDTARLQVPLRRALRHLGRCLQRRGLVEEELDVFFARYATIDTAVAAGSWEAVAGEIPSAKASFAKALASTPPWVAGETAPVSSAASSLRGIACSAGTAEGNVCIVRTSEDFPRLAQGAVLVASAVPPAWTPLIYRASAVVTEGGGPLSHGAIVAREAGIPAVMGVMGVSSVLCDGERVRVDGTSGIVSRLRN